MKKTIPLLQATLLASGTALAQDGNAGLSQATTLFKSYYDTAASLMYAIAGIMGLIGAVSAYGKMQHGHETGRAAIIWLAGCIFLVVVASVIKSFFGL
jgi:hypothetical protein